MRRAGTGLAAGLLGVGLLGGCAADPNSGYTIASTHGAPGRTVYVPMFANSTFYTGVEVELTEAVSKALQRSTGWRVAGVEAAETVLEATVRDMRVGVLSRQRGTGLVEEQSLSLTVDFRLVNATTGAVLAERIGFTATSTFIPSTGAGERIDRGRRSAVNELAADIVAELQSDW